MSDNFHDGTFIFEFFQFVLLNDLFLNLLDSNSSVLPFTSVDDTVAALTQFSVVLKLREWNLVVLMEHSILLHHKSEPSILSVINSYQEFLFNIVFVRT